MQHINLKRLPLCFSSQLCMFSFPRVPWSRKARCISLTSRLKRQKIILLKSGRIYYIKKSGELFQTAFESKFASKKNLLQKNNLYLYVKISSFQYQKLLSHYLLARKSDATFAYPGLCTFQSWGVFSLKKYHKLFKSKRKMTTLFEIYICKGMQETP